MKYFIDYFGKIYLGFKDYFTSVKYFARPEYRQKAYDLHFYLSYGIGLHIMFFIFWFTPIEDTSILSRCIIGAGIGWGMNFFKEWLWKVLYDRDADFNDTFFGSYGVVISTLVVSYLWKILF